MRTEKHTIAAQVLAAFRLADAMQRLACIRRTAKGEKGTAAKALRTAKRKTLHKIQELKCVSQHQPSQP